MLMCFNFVFSVIPSRYTAVDPPFFPCFYPKVVIRIIRLVKNIMTSEHELRHSGPLFSLTLNSTVIFFYTLPSFKMSQAQLNSTIAMVIIIDYLLDL